MAENRELILALAELAYSIAFVDGVLQDGERLTFESNIDAMLGERASIAKNHFALLDERVTPNVEQAYRNVMFAIVRNKEDFTGELKNMFIQVIENLANSVCGLRELESRMVERFKKDVELI